MTANIGGELWESMSQPWVKRIIEMTAEVEEMTFEGARRLIVERWEECVIECEAQGLSTARMWANLVRLANRA